MLSVSIQERQVPEEVIQSVRDSLKKCGLKNSQIQRISYSEQEISTVFSTYIHYYTYEFNGYSMEIQTQLDVRHNKEIILLTSFNGIRCP